MLKHESETWSNECAIEDENKLHENKTKIKLKRQATKPYSRDMQVSPLM